jgi:hypothetical protein
MADRTPTPAELPDGAAPAVEWTTDDRLLITELQSDLLPIGGLSAEAIVGAPIERLIPGQPLEPVIHAHQTALRGEVTKFSVTWGERQFVGWVSPLRADGNSVTGTAGLAMEVPAGAEALIPPDPRTAAMDGELATLCNDCGWDAGWLWHADEDGRLTQLTEWGSTNPSERLELEPYGWLAATTGERQWADPPGAVLLPCRDVPGMDGTLVLGLTRNETVPPTDLDAEAAVARLRSLFGRPKKPTRTAWRWPMAVSVPDRWSRTVLFGLMLPLPFLVTACFPPP